MATWGWGCADGHPPTCTSHKCEHKGNQETPHGEQEAGIPGRVSKQLCILHLMAHVRKDVFRIELFWLQEIYIKAEKEI